MRKSLLITTVLLLLLGSFVPSGAAQTQKDFWNSSSRTYYLHLMQYCERDVSLIRWIDEFDWSNDLDGCGGLVQNPENSWTDTFPAFTPFHANVTTGTTAEMHIFILSRAVDQTSVSTSLDLGYAKCAGSDGPEILVQEKVGGFHEFVIPCTFEVSGTADPLARPNLTVTVTATHTYGYGTEGDHASYFTLNGVVPAPPKEEVQVFEAGERPLVQLESEEEIALAEIPAAPPKAKSPDLGVAVVIGVLAFVGTALARRRSN